jgi:phosphoglycerate dehydrogenase-like enzyme
VRTPVPRSVPGQKNAFVSSQGREHRCSDQTPHEHRPADPDGKRSPSVAVVDCGPEDRPRLARLEAALPTVIANGPAADAVVERAAGARVLATLYTYTKVDAAILERLPSLRLVITRTAGHSHIDVAAAERLGIAVACVPDAPTIAVAEYTFAAILAMRRHLIGAAADTRSGGWQFTAFRGDDVAGQTLGVVGLGHIGTRVAELGVALGMRVLGWSRTHKDLPAVEQIDLDELLERSDVVSVNVALTPETHRLLDRGRLQRMRPGACLVNTARGEVLDLDALCELLAEGRMRGACLDVLEGEPVALERLAALADVPNLLITPHISWHSEGTLRRQFDGMVDRILAFCAGRPVELIASVAAPRPT